MITLPSWKECALAVEAAVATPLQRLIYMHEADGREDMPWRHLLAQVLSGLTVTAAAEPKGEQRIDYKQLRETGAYLARSGHHQAAALLAAEAGKLELAAEVDKKDVEIAELRQQLKVHE